MQYEAPSQWSAEADPDDYAVTYKQQSSHYSPSPGLVTRASLPPCLPDSRLHGCQPWKHCSLSMCIRHTGLGVWHSLQDNTSKSLHCPKKMFLTSCHSFRVQTQCVTSRNLIKYAVGCIGNFLLSSLFLRSI